ncbi:hypothetical protein LMF89_02850 [Pelosinus sp. Bkl1]|uniref:Uncharacterized protein n=1 Tax=Pelosinus baikalensis TaxID=2892015 RepID=A0ABS8HPX8_9FIRM|nr:hypothetical protein [Pelosinus baikalensis]
MIQYLLSKYNHEGKYEDRKLRKLQKKEDAYQGRMNKVQGSSEYSYAHPLPVYGYIGLFSKSTL